MPAATRPVTTQDRTFATYFVADVSGQRGHDQVCFHSFTSQLNLSALKGIGDARRGCVARVEGVLGGVWGDVGRQTRLKLS